MSAINASRQSPARAVARFFRTPKGILLLVLGGLAAVAAPFVGVGHVGPNVVSAMLLAALADLALAVWVKDELIFPSGALLTGLIVAMVLSPAVTPLVAGLSAAIAVGSKYLFHSRWSNVFNPAALALVVAYFLFGAEQSWWGALPDLPVPAVVLVVAAGLFIADRVNKVPMALAFLAGFYGLFTLTSFIGSPAGVAEVFRAPDVNAALFFALFMLDDPPTSPTKYRDQVVYALIAAAASYAIYVLVGAVYYLPAGLLLANAWETLRRIEERAGAKAREARPAPVAAGPRVPTAV